MASYNRVIIVGNLTRDVELRYIPSGTAVTDITLAVNERIKRNDQWVDEANFFDVTMWGRTAEVAAEYLSKGSNVLVEGRLRQEKWEQDGQKRSKVKVICDKMQMLGSKGAGQGGGSSSGNSSYKPLRRNRLRDHRRKTKYRFNRIVIRTDCFPHHTTNH